jgi:hypothetical protein
MARRPRLHRNMRLFLRSLLIADLYSSHLEPLHKCPLVHAYLEPPGLNLKRGVDIDVETVAGGVLKLAEITLIRLAREHGGTNGAASSAALFE